MCAPPPLPNSTWKEKKKSNFICSHLAAMMVTLNDLPLNLPFDLILIEIMARLWWRLNGIFSVRACARASINLAKRTCNMPINISADMSVERTVRDSNAHRAMQKLPIIISNEIHFDSCRDTYCISVQFITH